MSFVWFLFGVLAGITIFYVNPDMRLWVKGTFLPWVRGVWAKIRKEKE